MINQRFLPHQFVIEQVTTVDQMATAIREMHVRGAGLIGASAAYGMYLATLAPAAPQNDDSFDKHRAQAAATLIATRPTAVNLAWAIQRMRAALAVEGQA